MELVVVVMVVVSGLVDVEAAAAAAAAAAATCPCQRSWHRTVLLCLTGWCGSVSVQQAVKDLVQPLLQDIIELNQRYRLP
ncbi:hypothetical protein E2C01_067059 [Portunus trituberculatus]|uniref:Secreted protein n=1 Tax=Portunus trituberculatus TaxID=210409 RepID=A0A5B7HSL9_PORTR|nr:hypothetical protein [Portunus trituberculatus]